MAEQLWDMPRQQRHRWGRLLQEDLAVRECPLKSKDRANLLAGRDFDAATKVNYR